MPDVPDDLPKDIIDLIQRMIKGDAAPNNDTGGTPSIVGVKFIVGGKGMPESLSRDKKKKMVLEVMEEGDHYIIQTELPGECPNHFTIEYPEGKLRLLTGTQRNQVAEVALDNINPERTVTHLKNSVLEITCFKRNPEF